MEKMKMLEQGYEAWGKPTISCSNLGVSAKSVLSAPCENRHHMSIDARRLAILTAGEVDDLYGLPRFTAEDRRLYFDLSAAARTVVDAGRTASVAVHLTLQLGYFKAKRQFFIYRRAEVFDDVRYLLQQYFPTQDAAAITPPSKPTRLAQQRIILRLCAYRVCDNAAKDELEQKAQRIARLSTQPVSILREALQHLTPQRLVAPGYRFLQEMVGRVVAGERKRLTRLLGQALTPVVAQQCDARLEAGERLDRISTLKHAPKDCRDTELRREVARRQFFQPRYALAQTFLLTTGLSNESVKYYASLVQFYTVYTLQRMARPIARLSLFCFAFHRFRQINDTLTEAFIPLIDHYEKQAKQTAQDARQRAMTAASADLHAAGDVLRLFGDASIPGEAPFARVQEQAFSMLAPEHFPRVSDSMRHITFDKTACEWACYTTLSPTLKRNLRQGFCALDFAGRVEDTPLLEAVTFLQTLLRQGQSPRQTLPSTCPITVIPKALHPYRCTTVEGHRTAKRLEVDRYEFLGYRRLRNALEAGDVYVQERTEFRRFEDDLIRDTRWQDKDAVLREIGAPIGLAPIDETRAALRDTLDAKLQAVNQRLEDGTNTHSKGTVVAGKRRWRLLSPSEEDAGNSPFSSQLPGIGIAALWWFVAAQTGNWLQVLSIVRTY